MSTDVPRNLGGLNRHRSLSGGGPRQSPPDLWNEDISGAVQPTIQSPQVDEKKRSLLDFEHLPWRR
ncbi:hypothetical protein KX816_17610 [Sphingosinicellaceae bacterium]|nr:hypothetical protein KX816_17610 [Sphingosinicellaceae bacterium]